MFCKRAIAGYSIFWLLFLGAIALSAIGMMPGYVVYIAFSIGIFAVIVSLIASVSNRYANKSK